MCIQKQIKIDRSVGILYTVYLVLVILSPPPLVSDCAHVYARVCVCVCVGVCIGVCVCVCRRVCVDACVF